MAKLGHEDIEYMGMLGYRFESEAKRLLEKHGEFVIGVSVQPRKYFHETGETYYFLRSHVRSVDAKKISAVFGELLEFSREKTEGRRGFFIESQEKIDSLQGSLYKKIECS